MNTEIYRYIDDIIRALDKIAKQTRPEQSPGEWTRKIKEEIGRVGAENGFEVCAPGCKNLGYDTGWLYDLVWFRTNSPGINNEERRMVEIPLVLESEWDQNFLKIRDDFEKLLLANSPVKVMIFDNSYAFEKLKDGIKEYKHGVPSMYVLACYQNPKFQIRIFESNAMNEVKEITCCLSQNGIESKDAILFVENTKV